MKKITRDEERSITGGGIVTYSYSDKCSGRNSQHKLSHNTTIKGSSTKSVRAAKDSYNSKLRSHKSSKPNQTHNGKLA